MIRYELRRLLTRAAALAVCCFSLGLVHTPVNAGFKNGQWSSGHTVDWDTGNILPTPQWMPATGPSSGNTTWGVFGGLPSGTSNGRLPVGKGYIDVQARVIPDRASVARGLLNVARRSTVPLVVGNVLWDAFKESGCTLTLGGSSLLSITCTETSVQGSYYVIGFGGSTASSRLQACKNVQGVNAYVVQTGSQWHCYNQFGGGGYAVATNYENTVDNEVSKTEEQAVAIFASKNNWGPTSKLPEAIKIAADAGELIEASTPTVTGPSSVAGPTSTTTNPDGTTIVRTETHNVTYNGNSINYTTTIVTNNNGVVTTEVKSPEESQDQCAKYPDTVGCSELDSPETQVPKSTKNLSYTPEDLGLGGGSCPAPIPFTTSRGSWAIDLAPYCSAVTSYVRPMVILVAMFLAYLIVTGTRQMGGD